MIDLHMHTVYSDGDKTVKEVLSLCEAKKLEYISITDHNTAEEYEDRAFQENIFSGKIIKGVELNAVFGSQNIEILGYQINPDIINEWSKKYYQEENLIKQQKICEKRLLDICDKKGLVYNYDKIKRDIKPTDYIEIYIYFELIKHEENLKILGKFGESFDTFYRRGLADPKSSYFINRMEFRPKCKEVIDIIHSAGGKAFLAHPYVYKFDDTVGFIKKLKKETNLDGVECFHHSAEQDDRIDILIKCAKENNLYISGGSDYHGDKKPNIDLGVGKGSINIPKEIIDEWLN